MAFWKNKKKYWFSHEAGLGSMHGNVFKDGSRNSATFKLKLFPTIGNGRAYNQWTVVFACCCGISTIFKTCVCYFLSNFYFFTKWEPIKNYEKCFLFRLKSSYPSQDIQIFVIFSLLYQNFQIQKDKRKWNNLWYHELAWINLQK